MGGVRALGIAGVLFLNGCGLVRSEAGPTSVPSPAPFVQRYASPDEIAPVATIAAINCGKPYFGTFCGSPPRYVTRTPQ